MTVHAPVRVVPVPRQAGQVDAPAPASPAAASAPAADLGPHRPWTTDEKQFVMGLGACFGLLTLFLVPLLLLARYVWT
jgi:hypothetical protein